MTNEQVLSLNFSETNFDYPVATFVDSD